MNKKIIGIIAGVIIIGGGSFVGGMAYGKGSQSKAGRGAGGMANAAGIAGGFRGMRGGANGGGFTGGEVIAKDDKSITVKLRDGGSAIVFVSTATPVMKSVNGSLQDVAIGTQVAVTGTKNSDGSVSAQSIQIRPAQAMPPAGN